MVPCGSHQSLFGFADHERDSRNLSPVWTHPCLFTNSPNSSLRIRCFYNTKNYLTLVDLIGFCLGRDCGSCVSAVCPAIEWVTMRTTAICPKMNFLSRSTSLYYQWVSCVNTLHHSSSQRSCTTTFNQVINSNCRLQSSNILKHTYTAYCVNS